MKRNQRHRLETLLSTAALALTVATLMAAPALASVQYLNDGAMQTIDGRWQLPAKGSCASNPALLTKPECLAYKIAADTDSASCTTAGGAWVTSKCEDVANAGNQTACEALPGRVFNANTCLITMKGQNRNAVTCTILGGTWWSTPRTTPQTLGTCVGNWVLPDAETYTPPLLNRTGANPSTGDQCLRCHRSDTEWNSTRIRDVETFVYTGHKNMGRKVVPGMAWAGPEGDEYPADDAGNVFDWNTGQVTLAGTTTKYSLAWIYGDWLAPLPRSIYLGAAPVNNKPAMSYSCGRCHMTGWTSDAAVPTFADGSKAKEPEISFDGITWDGVSAPTTSVVNLAGGVTGDTNKRSSWDVWGISCSRCHGVAVENGAPGAKATRPMSAAANMSTHNNGMTAATGSMCSDPRFTSSNCAAGGGTVIAASGTAACSVAGICSDLNPAHNTQALCPAPYTWGAASDVVTCVDIAEYGKEHNIPAYAAAKYTGTAPQRGMIITGLCMQCHRQEAGGNPIEQTDASYVRVGNNHGALTFISHPGGNQYLNSPHGKYNGTFAAVPTNPFTYNPAGTGYKSFFIQDGEAKNTGNGCTGCHDVHNSMVEGATPKLGLREECTECHTKTQATTHHPTGDGTPFAPGKELVEACITCHMPNGAHLFRINTDAAYSTVEVSNPAAPNYALQASVFATGSSGVRANVAADGTYANAAWVDLDFACGQCHGGGVAQATATITAASSAVLTVASSAGFTPGARIRIKGVGSLQKDGVTRDDYYANIRSIDSATQITLVGAAYLTPTNGMLLEQNPTRNGAGYFSKATLATLAKGMHEDPPTIRFTVKPTALKVDFDASATTCQGSNANCNVFNWTFVIPGNPAAVPPVADQTIGTATGRTATFTFPQSGTYRIDLFVEQYSAGSGTSSKTITVNGPGPTASGTCTFDINTWIATVTNTSVAGTNANSPIRSVAVFWGDGSTITLDKTPTASEQYRHAYVKASPVTPFVLKLKATDNRGRNSTATLACSPAVAPAYFTLGGSVQDSTGANLPMARVQLYVGTKVFRAMYSDPTGAYSFGMLPPNTYTVVVTKTGYTFPTPAPTVTVGPSATAPLIKAQ